MCNNYFSWSSTACCYGHTDHLTPFINEQFMSKPHIYTIAAQWAATMPVVAFKTTLIRFLTFFFREINPSMIAKFSMAGWNQFEAV